MKYLVIVLMVCMVGCASTLTEDEQYAIDDKRQVAAELYAECRVAYFKAGVPWQVPDSSARGYDKIRSELLYNRCKRTNR